MSNVNFTPSIFSRPVYAPLESHGSGPTIMLADAEGGAALLDLADRDASVLDQAQVFYVPQGTTYGPRLQALAAKKYVEDQSFAALLAPFRDALGQAKMGTRLYLAGTEGLIGQAMAEALYSGLPAEAIQAEHRGSIARRMQCVHCKGVTEDVTTDPFTCSRCGLTLFVRDHFSRRLGAFQGVCVDAETPGELPETQEIKP